MKSNRMEIVFDAIPENEGLARVVASAFVLGLNPTLEQLCDIKTAVSEAVTNCIIHGYEGRRGKITMRCVLEECEFRVEIEDQGIGIDDVGTAMEPLYTSKPDDDRSGMGFSFMEAFMDELKVESKPGKGTKVIMKKMIEKGEQRESYERRDEEFAMCGKSW